jgi:hypothetical protein
VEAVPVVWAQADALSGQPIQQVAEGVPGNMGLPFVQAGAEFLAVEVSRPIPAAAVEVSFVVVVLPIPFAAPAPPPE